MEHNGGFTAASMALTFLAPDRHDDAPRIGHVRCYDAAAFGQLFENHVEQARRLARSILRDAGEAEDVVAEVFAATFAAIQRGKGPQESFARYVLSAVRFECYRHWRRKAVRPVAVEPETLDVPHGAPTHDVDDYGRLDEAVLLQAAFDSLPERCRTVLWQTEVEGLTHAEVAARTSSTPTAVAALAMRARRALADAYLQAHLSPDGEALGDECRDTRRDLAQVVRGSASPRRRQRAEAHLRDCDACRRARGELDVVNRRLRRSPLGGVLGLVALPKLVGLGAIKARLVSLLAAPAAPLSMATGLALVSAIGPTAAPLPAHAEDRRTSAPVTAVAPSPGPAPEHLSTAAHHSWPWADTPHLLLEGAPAETRADAPVTVPSTTTSAVVPPAAAPVPATGSNGVRPRHDDAAAGDDATTTTAPGVDVGADLDTGLGPDGVRVGTDAQLGAGGLAGVDASAGIGLGRGGVAAGLDAAVDLGGGTVASDAHLDASIGPSGVQTDVTAAARLADAVSARTQVGAGVGPAGVDVEVGATAAVGNVVATGTDAALSPSGADAHVAASVAVGNTGASAVGGITADHAGAQAGGEIAVRAGGAELIDATTAVGTGGVAAGANLGDLAGVGLSLSPDGDPGLSLDVLGVPLGLGGSRPRR